MPTKLNYKTNEQIFRKFAKDGKDSAVAMARSILIDYCERILKDPDAVYEQLDDNQLISPDYYLEAIENIHEHLKIESK